MPRRDDLRQKVMEAIDLKDFKKSEASQSFNISRNTINLWKRAKLKQGKSNLKLDTDLNKTY